MCKIFRTLVLSVAIMIAFASCKKSDDSPTSAGVGSFSLDGVTYAPSYGYLQQYQNSNSKNEYVVTFSDASSVQGLIDETRQIEMTLVIIPQSGTLDNGTYTGDATHQKNLIEAFVRLGNGVNEVQWTITNTYTGSITINKTNDIYDISYTFLAQKDGTSTGEKTITGSYKGIMTTVQ